MYVLCTHTHTHTHICTYTIQCCVCVCYNICASRLKVLKLATKSNPMTGSEQKVNYSQNIYNEMNHTITSYTHTHTEPHFSYLYERVCWVWQSWTAVALRRERRQGN